MPGPTSGLVVLDYSMPRLNGYETLSFVRQLSSTAKVIGLTAMKLDTYPRPISKALTSLLTKTGKRYRTDRCRFRTPWRGTDRFVGDDITFLSLAGDLATLLVLTPVHWMLTLVLTYLGLTRNTTNPGGLGKAVRYSISSAAHFFISSSLSKTTVLPPPLVLNWVSVTWGLVAALIPRNVYVENVSAAKCVCWENHLDRYCLH